MNTTIYNEDYYFRMLTGDFFGSGLNAGTISFVSHETTGTFSTEVTNAYAKHDYISQPFANISRAWVNDAGASIEVEDVSNPNQFVQVLTSNNNISLIGGGLDNSTNNRIIITDKIHSKGAVYASDYTANFTTYSLVTKGWVNSQISNLGGISNVDNGLSLISGTAVLGGTLSMNTLITNGGYYFTMSSTSSIVITNTDSISIVSTIINEPLRNLIKTEDSSTGTLYTTYLASYQTYSVIGAEGIISGSIGYGNSEIRVYPVGQSLTGTTFDNSTNNHMIVSDFIQSKGLVYDDNYGANYTYLSIPHLGYLQTNFGNKYTITITSTPGSTVTVTHNLNTLYVSVFAWDMSQDVFPNPPLTSLFYNKPCYDWYWFDRLISNRTLNSFDVLIPTATDANQSPLLTFTCDLIVLG